MMSPAVIGCSSTLSVCSSHLRRGSVWTRSRITVFCIIYTLTVVPHADGLFTFLSSQLMKKEPVYGVLCNKKECSSWLTIS